MNDDDRCLPRADVGLSITYSRKQGSHQWSGYGAIYLKMVLGQVLPWYLNFTDLLRDVFAMHMKWLRGQKENPDHFGPYPAAPVSRPWAWLGFKKA